MLLLAGFLLAVLGLVALVLAVRIARSSRGGPIYAPIALSRAQAALDTAQLADFNERRLALDPDVTVVLSRVAMNRITGRW
ncbi:hypothetical protein [Amycolatopsis sp. NBC_01480]|uniref:hypothetical protein n=1 Tax=Amycolatopsis sp. NBC_01480 TaxID=2903562 RepID=UPI002E290D4B|nr:hypothetical protein [Amycolatopsis sp. NBC_01480]